MSGEKTVPRDPAGGAGAPGGGGAPAPEAGAPAASSPDERPTQEVPLVGIQPAAAATRQLAGGAPAALDDAATAAFRVIPAAPPAPEAAPAPLAAGTVVDPEGRLRIERLLESHAWLNRYSALWLDATGAPVRVEVREAPAAHPALRREAALLADVRDALLPALLATFERGGRRYLVTDWREGETLEQALARGLPPERALALALQLSQLLLRLHGAGWALRALHPAAILPGAPGRLVQLGAAARIGAAADGCPDGAGYAAPEAAQRAVVTGREDTYALGALLYRLFAGQAPPEYGPVRAALGTLVRVPGAPQLLGPALGPAGERPDVGAFARHLRAFAERLARPALALQIAAGTTIGLNPTRTENEDAHAYLAWTVADHERAAHRAVLCVVDGMGGMAAGEVASRAAARAVLEGAAAAAGGLAPPDAVGLVRAAAGAVHAAARGRAVGATITCAVVDDGLLSLAHVGDTRAYLLRDGALVQLTRDHSVVAELVARGALSPAEARGHPDSNKVLRSLGGQLAQADDYIDTLAATRPEGALPLQDGDQLLLCSDGVWGVLDDDALRAILTRADDAPAVAQAVIRGVLAGNAPDNATLIVARCRRLPLT